MAHDPHRSQRDAALRAILVHRADVGRPSRRSMTGGGRGNAPAHLPTLVTVIVLVVVVALSAVAIAAGQSRTTAAGRDLAAPASSGTASMPPRPSSTPSTIRSVPLIAMDGARSLTRAQLHAWTLANSGDTADAQIGEQQDWLEIQCMAEHGYLYDPTFDGSQGLEAGKTWGLTSAQLRGYRAALWGRNLTSSKPYVWQEAGCQGRAVHLTGQDDDH